jgi:hypothetical protein
MAAAAAALSIMPSQPHLVETSWGTNILKMQKQLKKKEDSLAIKL